MLLLGAALAVVVFATSSAIGGAASAAAFALMGRPSERLSPSRRARWLFALRLFPTAFAVLVTSSFFLPAFFLLEPRDSAEDVGVALALAASTCLALVLRRPFAAARAFFETRSRVRGWIAKGEVLSLPDAPAPTYLVDADFPIVAVFGVRRPQVVMARSVRDAFTDREIAAVLEHERAHLSRGDNLTRLLLRGAPDLLAWTAGAERIEQAWDEAVEEAADRATRPSLALPLASALVKVARLAVSARAHPEAASALYRSGAITRRVRWLLRLETEAAPPGRVRPWSALLAFTLFLVASTLVAAPLGVLHRVHAVTEALVLLLQ